MKLLLSKMLFFSIAFAIITMIFSFPTLAEAQSSRIYVTNTLDNNVSVIDQNSHSVIATIPVGQDPRTAIVTPDGSKVYVANYDDATISVINSTRNTVIKTIPVGNHPGENNISINPLGDKVYVSNETDNTISIIDTNSNDVIATVAVGHMPRSTVVTPDGSKVYVANSNDNSVSIINTLSKTLTSTINNVGQQPINLAISPDGTKLYIVNAGTSSVSVLNTNNNTVIANIPVNLGIYGITVNPDGSKIYVSNNNCCNIGNGTVTAIDTNNNSVLAVTNVGLVPGDLSVTLDGSEVYVPNDACCGNPQGNNVSVINTASNKVIATINVGLNPSSTVVGKSPSSTDLNVPLLKQTSEPWRSQEYDTAHLWNPGDITINSWGCALTSAVMILQYYGIYTIPGTNFMPLTPGTLNDWLKSQPDGYVNTGWVNWLALQRFSKLAASELGILPFDALEYNRISGENKTQLTEDLNNNSPDILEEPGHFIVAKGISGNTFDINDPYYDFTTLDNTKYNNSFLSIGEFIPAKTDLSYIMLTTDPNTSITIKDQQGNIVGSSYVQAPITDPIDGESTNLPIKIYYLPKPNTGTYTITETNSTGPFQITSYLYDKDGNPHMQTINGLDNNSFIVSFDKTNNNNSSISKVITFESTLQDITNAQNLNLIDNGLATSLTEMLKNAQKQSAKNSTTAKILLNNGVRILDDHQNQTKIISVETYLILKNDFLSLKNFL